MGFLQPKMGCHRIKILKIIYFLLKILIKLEYVKIYKCC